MIMVVIPLGYYGLELRLVISVCADWTRCREWARRAVWQYFRPLESPPGAKLVADFSDFWSVSISFAALLGRSL